MKTCPECGCHLGPEVGPEEPCYPAGMIDDRVRAIVAEAISSERRRTAELLMEQAMRRYEAFGTNDVLVSEFTRLANELVDPER